MNIIIDPDVTRQRTKINANPPTVRQLTALCKTVGKVLNKRKVQVDTFRFCLEKIDSHREEERRQDGTSNPDKKPQQVGGFLIRLLADGTPCVGWTMACDKFNIELLTDEAQDIADAVQLHVTGTWLYCDPDGDRRVELGMPREPTENER